MNAEEFVLEYVAEFTDADGDPGQSANCDLWTSKTRIYEEARKHDDVDRHVVLDACEELADEGRVLAWNGLLAPVDADHVRAVIEADVDATVTRRILIGKCNSQTAD